MKRSDWTDRNRQLSPSEQLQRTPHLVFLQAMDLVILQAIAEGNAINRSLPAADLAEVRKELKAINHAARAAKLAWLDGLKSMEQRLADQFKHSDDPHIAQIGVCLSHQNYQDLAR